MNILWDPEIATCSGCGSINVTRRYTSDGIHKILCYACWHMLKKFALSDVEWVEGSCMIIEYEKYEKYENGKTQNAVLH
jgi:hypothetical protein